MTNGTSQGLFVVVAIVIFGIFVLISYLLFRDNLKPTLANIFTDGLEQSEENLTGIVKEKPIDVTAFREDETYLYAKIREADEAKEETEVWVQAKKLDDGTLEIINTGISDGEYTEGGTSSMTGSLIMPDTINGMKITSIGYGAFCYSKFTGELKLPDSLTSIDDFTFGNATFTGELKLPSGLTSIGYGAFFYSKFTGELKLPDSLTSIGSRAFENSTFTGELKLPSGLTSISDGAFYYSKFTGTLDVSNVKYVQESAFGSSKIDKVIRGDVKMSDVSDAYNTSGINPQSIKLANGSWYDGSNA